MSGNKDKQAEKGLENVEVALTRSEQFVEKNQKGILLGALGVVVIVAIIWMVNYFYITPNKHEAQKEIFTAQFYFEQDSFQLALNGDGLNAGFLQVIEDYGSTDAGKLAAYYAGVCYLNLGEYENAKKYLNSFSSDDEMLNSFAIGLSGDAESQLGNADAAKAAYKRAIDKGHKVTAPIFLMKLGAVYENEGDAASAKGCYQSIVDNYKTSSFASTAEKYLNSVK